VLAFVATAFNDILFLWLVVAKRLGEGISEFFGVDELGACLRQCDRGRHDLSHASHLRVLEILQVLLISDDLSHFLGHSGQLSAHSKIFSVGANFVKRAQGILNRIFVLLILYLGFVTAIRHTVHASVATEVVLKSGGITVTSHAGGASEFVREGGGATAGSAAGGTSVIVIEFGGAAVRITHHASWAAKVVLQDSFGVDLDLGKLSFLFFVVRLSVVFDLGRLISLLVFNLSFHVLLLFLKVRF